jgi:RNA polymerase sigma factor (sigma-70 family)
MDGPADSVAAALRLDEAGSEAADTRQRDLESSFHTYYKRLARIIARLIRDTARAEELAVDVLLKWSRNPRAQGDWAEAWLHRTAVRSALNELRRAARRARYERLFGVASVRTKRIETPEETHATTEAAEQVRTVLRAIRRRHAELLVLRSHGLTYAELASSLGVNPASVGTLLARAQQAFRKEYVKRYGAD